MITWNEIITMAAAPEKRLNVLLGAWQDILILYRDPQIMHFDPETFLAIVSKSMLLPSRRRYLLYTIPE